jgi:hypothetical protein
MIESGVKAQVAQNGDDERNLTSQSTRPLDSVAFKMLPCGAGRMLFARGRLSPALDSCWMIEVKGLNQST